MNDSIYSKVIFSEVSETYPTDADIECRFYIGHAVVATDNDTIGLFKLGWTQPSQRIVSKSVTECQTDKDFGERKLKFMASELPKDGEEFYQFCYFNATLGICGASTPFRLFRPHERDLIQLDNRTSDDEDFVVVRSQQALLQERLQQMVNANGVLEYSKRSMEQQNIALIAEVNELRKIKGELEARIKFMQIEGQGLNDFIKNSEDKYYQQCTQMENLEQELAELKKIRNDQDMHLEATQLELMRLTEKLNSLELRDSSLIQQLEQRNQESAQLFNKVADQQVMIGDVRSKMSLLEAELELSRATNANVMSDRRDLDLENRLLRNELEDIKAKCDALEGNKELMLNEISDLLKVKLKMSVELKVMMENMDEIRKKLEENESYQKVMSDERKANETEMQKQLEEMKMRLTQAADEYQKLYKQNAKLESRIDRIKSKVGFIRLPEQEKANIKTVAQTSVEQQPNTNEPLSAIEASFVFPSVQTIQSTSLPTQPASMFTSLPMKSVQVDPPRAVNQIINDTERAEEAASALSSIHDRPQSADEIVEHRERSVELASAVPSVTSVKTLIQNNRTNESHLNRSEQTDNYESINIITLPCTMCDEKILCTERDLKPMTNHLEEKHAQRLCPVCSILFDFNIVGAENYFRMHVENHFAPNNQN